MHAFEAPLSRPNLKIDLLGELHKLSSLTTKSRSRDKFKEASQWAQSGSGFFLFFIYFGVDMYL